MSGHTVLVVDDDPTLAVALRSALEGRDVDIETAYDVTTALSLLDNRYFCGLVLDLVLGGDSGFDVRTHLDRRGVEIPTVVVSQKLPSYVREMLDHERVKLVFPKPVDARVLGSVVLGLCGIAA